MKTMAATMGANRPNFEAVRMRNAPARPPSTASGGKTNTKCRMPLYIAGCSAIVVAKGQQAGECDQEKNGAPVERNAGCEGRKRRTGRAAKPEDRKRSPEA